jgi:hypothetical protein
MKNIIFLSFFFLTSVYAQQSEKTTIDQQFKNYWFGGKAEITSYDLLQERYGEIRKGHAVNIFVTEPFSKEYNTKADKNDASNINVFKLNATKKFTTGIYPYSVMTSSFIPVKNPNSSLKISSSTQEWCGHEYIELTQKNNEFKISNSSYFQGASFKNKALAKDIVLEDDIWSKIRLTPESLPQGNFKILPSFVYLRFSHHKVDTYNVIGSISKEKSTSVYTLNYPKLQRTLTITFENAFPYKILEWTDTYQSGWGANKKMLTTKAILKKTLNIPYWEKNKNSDSHLRKELGLE